MSAIVDALGATLNVPDTGTTPDPAPGQFWVVAYDNVDRAVVLVSATGRGDHVLAWPVTAATPHAGYPTLSHRLGDKELTVWPELEFGLALVALDRMIGSGPSTRLMREVIAAIEDRGPMPTGTEPGPDTPEVLAAIDLNSRQAWALADLEWPRAVVGEGVVDAELLRERGIDTTDLRELLHVEPGRAADLAAGAALPTQSEVDALSETVDHVGRGVLIPASGSEVAALSSPRLKARIRQVASRLDLPENVARSRILHRSLAAARQQYGDPETQAQARVEHAINDLLSSP